MLRELDHRMKNNFQTVASLLRLQLRRIDRRAGPACAAGGAEPCAQHLRGAPQPLRRRATISAASTWRSTCGDLCANLADALLLGELVRLECSVEPGALDRDRAVAVGLIVNELVTNAAKHAFTDGKPGQIRVAFARQPRRLSPDRRGRRPRPAGRLRHPPPGPGPRAGRGLHPPGRRLADRRRRARRAGSRSTWRRSLNRQPSPARDLVTTGRSAKRAVRGQKRRDLAGIRLGTGPYPGPGRRGTPLGRGDERRRAPSGRQLVEEAGRPSSAGRSRRTHEVGALDRRVAGVGTQAPREPHVVAEAVGLADLA